MNYFGLFFSFMLPGIVIGVMIAVAFAQERAARKRRAVAARGNSASSMRSYTPAPKAKHTPAPANSIKSDGSKLYIYDMNAA